MSTFNLSIMNTLTYDTVIVGGGFAGVGAAVASASNGASTLLIECSGELGGDITKAIVPQILDKQGKGGIIQRLYDKLNEKGNTSARKGARYDADGNKIQGTMTHLEYVKYHLEQFCREAGADVLLYSMMAGCEVQDRRIERIAVATECGCVAIKAKTFIDATGNGLLAAMAGCEWEIGHPETSEPQPASSAMYITGLSEDAKSTDSGEEKQAARKILADNGIDVSAEVALMHSTVDNVWMLTFNNQFGVMMDDQLKLSCAAIQARAECIEVLDKLYSIQTYKNAQLLQVSSHIGIREGKRIRGQYRLTIDDITEGKKFEDAICTVRFPVDIHSLNKDENAGYSRGNRTLAYHIPYRALVPLGCDNLLLAGRCISGDFYAHASYRVAGCVAPMGEAAGYAAALCAKNGVAPISVDTHEITKYMINLGYEI